MHGAASDWRGPVRGRRPRRWTLPTYAFQHQRYWLDAAAVRRRASAGTRSPGHPLLGAAVAARRRRRTVVFTGRCRVAHPAVAGRPRGRRPVLLPGTGAAWSWRSGPGTRSAAASVDELTLHAPLVLPGARRGPGAGRGRRARTRPATRPVTVHAGRHDERRRAVDRHATGVARPAATGRRADRTSPRGRRPAPSPSPWTASTPARRDRGYRYGPAFQGLRAAWRRGTRGVRRGRAARARTSATPTVRPAPGAAGRGAARRGAGRRRATAAAPRLPFCWSGVTLHAAGATALRVRLSPAGPDARRCCWPTRPAARSPRSTPWPCARWRRSSSTRRRGRPATALFHVDWTPVPVADTAFPGRYVMIGGDTEPLARRTGRRAPARRGHRHRCAGRAHRARAQRERG